MQNKDSEKNVDKQNQEITLEEALKTAIQKIQKSEETSLTKEEIRSIIDELIPDLDKLISKKVKEHLHMLGNKMQEIFGKGD